MKNALILGALIAGSVAFNHAFLKPGPTDGCAAPVLADSAPDMVVVEQVERRGCSRRLTADGEIKVYRDADLRAWGL